MDELLARMSSEMNGKNTKRKHNELKPIDSLTPEQQELYINKFLTWIHNGAEPEKRMIDFGAAEKLGCRSSCGERAVVKIQNFLPGDVAEGALCLMKRINTWTTSSALNDKHGNKSSYGAGSTDHQFQASSCLHDHTHKKDFKRFYEIIASLLPKKDHNAFQVGKYTEGHFIDAHDDAAYLDIPDIADKALSKTTILCSRDIAMVFYLTKDWSADNGGCFIDLVGGEIITPQFNTCILFHVPRLHRVEPVLNSCVRYSIFGWFFQKGRLYELDTGQEQKPVNNGEKSSTKLRKKSKLQRTNLIDKN